MTIGPLVTTVREQIAEHIRAGIFSGKWEEGEQLREEPLAKRFGVSRGPIRDVLLQLTKEGLLVSKPNCGVRVGSAPDPWLQPLIVDTRLRIETFAMRKVFRKINEDALAHLDNLVRRLREACKENDVVAIAMHDMAFHRYLLEIHGDDAVVAIWLPIVQRMMLHYTRHSNLMESHKEHAEIVDALRAKDRKKALAALKQNIQ